MFLGPNFVRKLNFTLKTTHIVGETVKITFYTSFYELSKIVYFDHFSKVNIDFLMQKTFLGPILVRKLNFTVKTTPIVVETVKIKKTSKILLLCFKPSSLDNLEKHAIFMILMVLENINKI